MNRKILSVIAIVAIAVCLASVMFAMPASSKKIVEHSKTLTGIKVGEPITFDMSEVSTDYAGTVSVTIVFNRDVDKAEVYGAIYDEKPEDWPAAPGDFIVYSDRTIIDPPLTTIATVEFHTFISKEVCERENLDPNSVIEYRMAEVAAKWLPQEAKVEGEDDDKYYIRSLSVFFPHTNYAASYWHPR